MREIRKRVAGMQKRPGGWCKFPGMSDPGAVMIELVEQVEHLEGKVEAMSAKPKKASTKKRTSKKASTKGSQG